MREKFTFKGLRVSKKLDVNFLARQFEVSESQIEAIEMDSSDVSCELLEDFLDFFEVSYDEIYIGKGRQDPLARPDQKKLDSKEVNTREKFVASLKQYAQKNLDGQARNFRSLFHLILDFLQNRLKFIITDCRN